MGYLFSSESVTIGHPDKVCDAISDAIVDACLAQDSKARVAVETCVKGMEDKSVIILAGEVTVAGETPDYERIARNAAVDIGYDSHDIGMDASSPITCDVHVFITTQSPNIAQGVDRDGMNQGAGDQGIMFGYACEETESFPAYQNSYFPLTAAFAQSLTRRLTDVRTEGILDWVRPDGKSQVTIEYDDNGTPLRVHTVILAAQHDKALIDQFGGSEQAEHDFIHAQLTQNVVKEVIPSSLLDDETHIIINGTGRFADPGGPYADAGLTGRKIIVDTYGGMGRHGGGAFSGKDPSKVDRSAAYAARWAAKHVVAAGLASRCEIQLGYVIGVAKPVSLKVDTFGTSDLAPSAIEQRLESAFDFRPAAIAQSLGLLRPIYGVTAAGGHFGRLPEDGHFPWEALDSERIIALQQPQ